MIKYAYLWSRKKVLKKGSPMDPTLLVPMWVIVILF